MQQVVIHQNLARLFTHKSFGAPHQRAYVLWAYLRSQGKTWHFYDEVVDMYVSWSKKHPDTVKSWIKQGVEMSLFTIGRYHDGRQTLSIVGKIRVFNRHLGGDLPPGKAVLVDADVLMSANLQKLRSLLLYTISADKKVIRSRAYLAGTIDRVEQTTRNYSRVIAMPKQYCFSKLPRPIDGRKMEQRPNAWGSHPSMFTRGKPVGKVHHLYKAKKLPSVRKLYYYDRARALKAAKRRDDGSVVFHILDDSEIRRSKKARLFGHIFLEPITALA